MIPWLAAGQPFPPARAALAHPNGLLAASRELSVERLLTDPRPFTFGDHPAVVRLEQPPVAGVDHQYLVAPIRWLTLVKVP